MEIYKGLLSKSVSYTKNEEKNYPNMLCFFCLTLYRQPLSTVKPDGFSWDLLARTTAATATENRLVYACVNATHTNSAFAPQFFFLH